MPDMQKGPMSVIAIIGRLRGFVTADASGASVTEDEMLSLLDCAEALAEVLRGRVAGSEFSRQDYVNRVALDRAQAALAALERSGK